MSARRCPGCGAHGVATVCDWCGAAMPPARLRAHERCTVDDCTGVARRDCPATGDRVCAVHYWMALRALRVAS